MPTAIALEFRDIDPSFDHKERDAKVIQHLVRLSPVDLAIYPPTTFGIISAVAGGCPFMLQASELDDVTAEHEAELKPYAMKAWDEKKFEQIRRIGMSAILLSAHLTIYLTSISRVAEAAGFTSIVSKRSRRAK